MGEILYIEESAHERDQVLYACAAQEPKLLPPQKAAPKGSGSAIFKAKVLARVNREQS